MKEQIRETEKNQKEIQKKNNKQELYELALYNYFPMLDKSLS